MFLVRAGGEEGCALATADGGAVQVRELLCPAAQRPAGPGGQHAEGGDQAAGQTPGQIAPVGTMPETRAQENYDDIEIVAPGGAEK